MKKYLYILFVLIIFSCKENEVEPVIIPNDCTLPIQLTDPNAPPIDMQYANSLSPDGTKLLFCFGTYGGRILDINNIAVTQFDIRPSMPQNTKLGGFANNVFWCPYDNNKFAVSALIGVDTIGDGKQYPGRYHIVICSIDGTYYKDITPDIFLPMGSETPIGLYSWLPSSTEGNDLFFIGYKITKYGKKYYGVFNPSTQELIEEEYKGLSTYTKDYKYRYYVNYDSSYKLRYYINENELVFNDIEYANTSYACFSPDGKYFAIAANVYDNDKYIDSCRLAEVWIVDVEEFMNNPVQPVPVKIINIKEKLCMFSYGLHPVFTSNNTMAVSMFKSGDNCELLYEIDLEGNLIRQLTF